MEVRERTLTRTCAHARQALGAMVVREPIGVVGCITPWNYPLNQIAAKICPARHVPRALAHAHAHARMRMRAHVDAHMRTR